MVRALFPRGELLVVSVEDARFGPITVESYAPQ